MKIISNIQETLNTLYGDDIEYEDITRKEYKDIIEGHINSLNNIYEFLEKNGYCGDDLYNLGDAINLVNKFKNLEEKDLGEKDFINKSKDIMRVIKCLDSYESYKEFVENYREYDATYLHIMEGVYKNIDFKEQKNKEIEKLQNDISLIAYNYLFDNV